MNLKENIFRRFILIIILKKVNIFITLIYEYTEYNLYNFHKNI